MQFIKNIQNTAFKYNLWKKGDKIIIAVSGGPDSVCLLDVLAFLAPKYGFKLKIAHVNYGLRGKDSDRDEQFVRDLGKKYGISANILHVKTYPRGKSEQQLRDIRYHYFEKICKKYSFNSIAVAHNSDDQIETVLMRIIRGSGLQGLSAMKTRSGNIIRPLLEVEKKDILAYLKEKKLKRRIDKSNLSSDYTRNKIRNRLLPYLAKNFNPSIKKALHVLATTVADDYDLLSSQTVPVFELKNGTTIAASAKKLVRIHPSILRQQIRNALAELKGDKKDLSLGQIEEIRKIISSIKNKIPKMEIHGLIIMKKGDMVTISQKR